jgi:divalent metal cation (Fe/Co/Zn/Cd) transporter
MTLSAQRQKTLSNRIRLMVSLTIGYNVVEAVVAIAAGSVASSTALVAFGLDSVIEVLSAVAVAWQFAGKDPEAREKTALRLIAVSFFALSAYVLVDSGLALWRSQPAEHSPVGIILTVLSLLIMPLFSFIERRTGMELGSSSAVSDSKQTLLCSLLSGAVLIGLLLNSLLGWWQADPICALFIAVLAVKEGVEALKGDSCTTPISQITHEDNSLGQ